MGDTRLFASVVVAAILIGIGLGTVLPITWAAGQIALYAGIGIFFWVAVLLAVWSGAK